MKRNIVRAVILLGLVFLVVVGYEIGGRFETSIFSTLTPEILPFVTEEEYSVYDVVIAGIRWSDKEPALIKHETCSHWRPEEDIEGIDNAMPDLQEETLANFIAQIEEHGVLQKGHFDFPHAVFRVDDYSQPQKIGKEEELIFNWDLFRATFPRGSLICVSRVGFNHEHTQAFLYAESSLAPLSGRGFYVLLSYDDVAWKIDEIVLTWMS